MTNISVLDVDFNNFQLHFSFSGSPLHRDRLASPALHHPGAGAVARSQETPPPMQVKKMAITL